MNNDRLGAAQAAKKEKKAAAARRAEAEDEMRDDGEEDEEVGDGDWERATEESLAKALKDAKASVSHATSYLIGDYSSCLDDADLVLAAVAVFALS